VAWITFKLYKFWKWLTLQKISDCRQKCGGFSIGRECYDAGDCVKGRCVCDHSFNGSMCQCHGKMFVTLVRYNCSLSLYHSCWEVCSNFKTSHKSAEAKVFRKWNYDKQQYFISHCTDGAQIKIRILTAYSPFMVFRAFYIQHST